jgi:hypothetical protein
MIRIILSEDILKNLPFIKDVSNAGRSVFLQRTKAGGLALKNNIEQLSQITINKSDDLYKIVDNLNRTLKKQDLMFGLALDQEDINKMVFTIYRT